MAAGTVPITFSNIGTRSLICDSKAGVLAENISELRDAALCILKDSSIGIHIQGIVWRQLTFQLGQYSTVYENLFSSYQRS